MMSQNFTSPAPGTVLALLTLPQSLAPHALLDLGQALAGVLGTGSDAPCGQADSRAYAAEVEYASWLPCPAAIEVASWAVHMRSLVQ